MSELVVTVFRLEGMLAAIGDELAAPSGQSTARWRILAAVEQTPMSVAQIARAWSLTRQSVQRVADLLERDGLVIYEENPAHRRAKLVQLTPQGHAALATIQHAQHDWANRVGERIGIDALPEAQRLLSRIAEALHE